MMALLTLEQAAARLDTPRETIQEWVRLGLLPLHEAPVSSPHGEQHVEEEELLRIAESMGWLQLSQQNWDDAEEN
jgi:hypothetical protein